MKTPVACPCGSSRTYVECCQPFHEGQPVTRPEDLVRSRYSAFVVERFDYVLDTMHSTHEDAKLPRKDVRAALQKHRKSIRYRGLSVLGQDGPDAAGVSRALFVVELYYAGTPESFVELSSFAEEDGRLRYVTGIVKPTREVKLEGLTIASFAGG